MGALLALFRWALWAPLLLLRRLPRYVKSSVHSSSPPLTVIAGAMGGIEVHHLGLSQVGVQKGLLCRITLNSAKSGRHHS